MGDDCYDYGTCDDYEPLRAWVGNCIADGIRCVLGVLRKRPMRARTPGGTSTCARWPQRHGHAVAPYTKMAKHSRWSWLSAVRICSWVRHQQRGLERGQRADGAGLWQAQGIDVCSGHSATSRVRQVGSVVGQESLRADGRVCAILEPEKCCSSIIFDLGAGV